MKIGASPAWRLRNAGTALHRQSANLGSDLRMAGELSIDIWNPQTIEDWKLRAWRSQMPLAARLPFYNRAGRACGYDPKWQGMLKELRPMKKGISRRTAIRAGLCVCAGAFIGSGISALAAESQESGITPNEDLMKEHGAIIRMILVYQEIARRMRANESLPGETLGSAAQVVHEFSGNYHEKLEENQVFPRFADQGGLAELIKTLKTQHDAGRRMTKRLLEISQSELNAEKRAEAIRLLDAYARMYYPHMGWEDTVLFPAFRSLLPENEYARLGEEFEEIEHKVLGEGGFERTLATVIDLEKALGIHDLSRFTPSVWSIFKSGML